MPERRRMLTSGHLPLNLLSGLQMGVILVMRPGLWLSILCLLSVSSGCRKASTPIVINRSDIIDFDKYNWSPHPYSLDFQNNTKILTKSIILLPGRYSLFFTATGKRKQDVLPAISIFLGSTHVVDQAIAEGTKPYVVNFVAEERFDAPLSFRFANFESQSGLSLMFPVSIKPYDPLHLFDKPIQ